MRAAQTEPSMWNRILVASLAASVLVLSAVSGVSAEGLNTEQWTAFAQQQPLLSRLFVAHESSAVASLFGKTVDQLKSEVLERSLPRWLRTAIAARATWPQSWSIRRTAIFNSPQHLG